MKRLPTGLIVLDTLDIICISFSAGSGLSWLVKLYRKRKRKIGEDPIITELKEKSPIKMFSENGKPLKLPLVRGGDRPRGFSLLIKNKKLARILMAIVTAKKKQRQLRLLGDFFILLNTLLTTGFGLRFAVGGSLDYTQIILFGIPSTVGGFVMGQLSAYPIFGVLVPIAILYGRGIEDIIDPYDKCKAICKAAEEYHSKQLRLEMENFNSLIEETAAALQLPIDKVPLICVEQRLSLLERYKLREVVKSAKARKRVQHFSEFIKKFPECNADPEVVFEEILHSKEKIKLLN